MFQPPFCPNRYCSYYHHPPQTDTWYTPKGYYHTKAFGPVPRYTCLGCGKGFSRQTFRLDYYVKHPLPYWEIVMRLTSGCGVRSAGRHLHVSHQVILNRISRLGRQAVGLQAGLLNKLRLCENLCTDGFESFAESHYQPNNIHILVGKRSQFLYGFDYAHLKRKGMMNEAQKAERDRREKRRVRERITITKSFCRLTAMIEELVETSRQRLTVVYSDEKQEYARVLRRSRRLQQLRESKRFAHIQISSRLARTLDNPLFAVNYMDRQFRKDNANHVRKTIQYSRNVNYLLERLAIYQMLHNCYKPYRVDKSRLRKVRHAQMAGIPKGHLERELADIFEYRHFLFKLTLYFSQAMVWLRMVGSVEHHCGGYWPKYVWM